MADDLTPGSPEWWLNKLENELDARREGMQTHADYVAGDHPLPFLPPKHAARLRSEFRQLLIQSRSNFMRLVVEAPEERLRIEGFRLSAESDEEQDRETWRIWQANQMDAEHQTAISEALTKKVSYLSVWPGDRFPTIAVEDPLQTIVAHRTNGEGRRVRVAALKRWADEWTGDRRANVYLPDGIYKFEEDGRNWGSAGFVPTAEPVVPIVPLYNVMPGEGPIARGTSEISDGVYSQDRINTMLFFRQFAGFTTAHRQKWVSGITFTEDPETGQLQEPFDSFLDKLAATEKTDAKFGTFDPTELKPYIDSIEQDVLHLAVQTRTPRHYLIQQGQSPSGDALRSAETGLVAKVRRKMRYFGEGFEEALRLARRMANLPDAPPDSEVIWGDPEYRTLAEATDAIIKQYQAGLITWRVALTKLGYSPQEIDRMEADRTRDAFVQALAGSTGERTETTTTVPESPEIEAA